MVWHGSQRISPRFVDEEGLVHYLFSSDGELRFFSRGFSAHLDAMDVVHKTVGCAALRQEIDPQSVQNLGAIRVR